MTDCLRIYASMLTIAINLTLVFVAAYQFTRAYKQSPMNPTWTKYIWINAGSMIFNLFSAMFLLANILFILHKL